MNFQTLYRDLDKRKYFIFSFADLLAFYPREKRESLKKMLYRWRKKGWIVPLKKGLYELSYPRDLVIPDMYVANNLYGPSYVSLETALSKYSVIPQVSMAVTSITTNSTRRFKNRHGLFIYRTVRPEAFTGYCIEHQGDFSVRIAEPEKALVDFLYFKKYRTQKVDFKAERFDKAVLAALDKRKIARWAKLYNLEMGEFYAYLKRSH